MNEKDLKLNETVVLQEENPANENLKPSNTILLPEIDNNHFSFKEENLDLDELIEIKSKGLEITETMQWLVCTLKERKIQHKFRLSQMKKNINATIKGL